MPMIQDEPVVSKPSLRIEEEDDQTYSDAWNEFFEYNMPTEVEAAREWITANCDSTEKIPALLFLHGQIDFSEWLRLLGWFWTNCDKIGLYADDLLWIFREWLDHPDALIPELMDEEERAVYDALPEQVTIYRGCGRLNRHGFSWSLSRDVAAWFPFSARSRAEKPLLLTATIPKTRAAAVKLRGREQEVIVVGLPDTAWTEEVLTEAPPPYWH